MKKSYYIILCIVITINCLYAQKSSVKEINKISEIISSVSASSDDKLFAIIDLLKFYNKSDDKIINSYVESILIKSTNFSNTLFFHEFELRLEDELKKINLNKFKMVRLYLILSNKEKESLDYRYFSLCKKKINTPNNNLYGIEIKKCNSNDFIEKKKLAELLAKKDYITLNSYYLNLIYCCNEYPQELEKVKRLYIFVK
jgi:hypothetical protein